MVKPWFKRKSYGWGLVPVTWQGSLVTALYVTILVKFFLVIDARSHSVSDTLIGFAPLFIVTSLIFMFVGSVFGENPRLKWGREDRIDSK